MDLSSLYNTLSTPPDRLQQAENEMMERFKAAALSITHLYKSSVHTSKQAYRAGYSACLNDVLQTLQASLSTSSPSLHPRTIAEVDSEAVQGEEAGKVLGRLMDWVEARQEAIKLETEEEKEKEDAESSGTTTTTTAGAGGSKLRRPVGPARVDLMQPERPVRSVLQGTPTPVRTTGAGAASGSGLGGMKMDEVEEPTAEETGTDVDGGTMLTKKPSGAIRQRDALVQAVANARAKGSGNGMKDEPKDDSNKDKDRFAPLALTRPSSPIPITANNTIRESANPNPSSPLTPTPQAYAGHHRPFKGFGQHYRGGTDHRSKLLNLNRKEPHAHAFNPNFGNAEVPLFPGTEAVADVQPGATDAYGFLSGGIGGNGIGTAVVGAPGGGVGGKRAHENAFGGSAPVAVPLNGGGNNNSSVFGSAPTNHGMGFGNGGGNGRGRRRGGNHGFAGFAMRGNGASVQVQGSEGEDDVIEGRERKRIARR